jgi:peptidoglycan/xylan/chitin deacetylase (PgdA/CDA1 family)
MRPSVPSLLLGACLLASTIAAPQVHAESNPPPTDPTTTTTVPLTVRDVKVWYRIPTRDKVVFITIDDGFTVTPELAKVLKRHKVPITTFAIAKPMERNKEWFLARDNMTFENHTVNHRSLTFLSVRAQQREICGANRRVARLTGTTPVLFRPPGGNFTAKTKRAMANCGLEHLVMWNVIAEGNVLRMPKGGLKRGDIILMHYLKSTASTLELLLRQIKKDGLRPALLRDYLS